MKNLFGKLLLPAIIILFAASCKKAPQEANLIPKTASTVFAFDGKALVEKLEKGGLPFDSLASLFGEEIKAEDKAKFEDLKNSGIDWSEKTYVFIEQGGNMMTGMEMTFGIVAKLADASKLEAMIKKHDSSLSITKEANFSYVALENDFVLSWNDKNILGVGGANVSANGANVTGGTLEKIKKIYALKKEESMASEPKFVDLMKENADGYFFSSSNASLGMATGMMGGMAMGKLSELLKDNFTTGTFNFNDGEAVMKSTFWPNDKVKSILDKSKSREIDLNSIKTFPAASLNGFFAMAFDSQVFADLLKEMEVAGVVDAMLGKAGFTSADVIKAIKGDVTVMVGDFSVKKAADSSSFGMINTTPEMKYIARIDVGDKTSFAKLMDAGVKEKMFIKTGNKYTLNPSVGDKVVMEADENMVLISQDANTLQQYKAGTSKLQLSSEVESLAKGKVSAMYVDLIKTLGALKDGTKEQSKSLDLAVATFKDAYVVSDKMSGGKISGEGKLRFNDTKTNSLVTFMKFLAALKKEQEGKRSEIEESWSPNDSTIILDAPKVDTK